MYVVCSQNIALGVFTSMEACIDSILLYDENARTTKIGAYHTEMVAKGNIFTATSLVQKQPFDKASNLIRK